MKAALRLTIVLGVLMLAQAGLGLMFREQYRDVEWISATWLGNDVVTLAVSLPLIAASLGSIRRRSDRSLLLWMGILGYALYNYAYYLFGAALNAFFPLYLAALITAALALVCALAAIPSQDIAGRFGERAPARSVGGYFVFVGIGLSGIWLSMWAAYVFAGRPTPVEPEAFKLVAALDTVLMAPALVGGGILLWQRKPWGYVISAIAGVQASLYLLVLSLNSIIFVARGLADWPGEAPLWSGLAAATSAVTSVLFAHAGKSVEV